MPVRVLCRAGAAVVALASVLVVPAFQGTAAAGGPGANALRVAVTTNGIARPLGQQEPLLAGAQLARRYVISNASEATLVGVTVLDGQVPAGAIRCPGGTNRIATLPALSTVTCTALAPALAGWRAAVVRVAADVHLGPLGVSASVTVSYFGVNGSLRLRELVNGARAASAPGVRVRPGEPVRLRYVLTNTGNVPLTGLTVRDSLGGGPAISCGPTGDAAVARLDPGQQHVCTARLVAQPGRQRGAAVASAAVISRWLGLTGLWCAPGRVTAADRAFLHGMVAPPVNTPTPTGPPAPTDSSDSARQRRALDQSTAAAATPTAPATAAVAVIEPRILARSRVDRGREPSGPRTWGLMMLTFVVLLVPGIIATRGLRRRG